jgi:hypothetical protein
VMGKPNVQQQQQQQGMVSFSGHFFIYWTSFFFSNFVDQFSNWIS